MENELRKAIEEWVEYRIEQNKELEKKYPPNPPNDVCKMAYMKGLLIENSFEPEVGEMNELFEVEHEKVFVWTHEKDRNSSIIIKVDPECILQSPADSDAFQSGRCAKHNGRPETMYF